MLIYVLALFDGEVVLKLPKPSLLSDGFGVQFSNLEDETFFRK
jgi:hypothetical protein